MNLIKISIALWICILCNSCYEAPKNEKKDAKISEKILKPDNLSSTDYNSVKFRSLKELINFYDKKTDSLDKIRIAALRGVDKKKILDKDSVDLIDSLYDGLIEERNKNIFSYLEKNEKTDENLLGILFLVVNRNIPILSIDSLFKKFPQKIRNSQSGEQFFKMIEERKRTDALSTYNPSLLNLNFENRSGDKITLNGIGSKYILLDFWASWCAPCRYQNRMIAKKKATIFENSKVELVAVSLDENKNKWIKAAIDDGLNYLTVCDFKGFNSPLAKGLKIEKIPYCLLIDMKGNILARNVWGKELSEFVKTLK